MTTTAFAERIGTSPQNVRNWCVRMGLPHQRDGAEFRVPALTAEQWLRDNGKGPYSGRAPYIGKASGETPSVRALRLAAERDAESEEIEAEAVAGEIDGSGVFDLRALLRLGATELVRVKLSSEILKSQIERRKMELNLVDASGAEHQMVRFIGALNRAAPRAARASADEVAAALRLDPVAHARVSVIIEAQIFAAVRAISELAVAEAEEDD